MKQTFKIGDKIYHKTYGNGTVEQVYTREGMIEVLFEKPIFNGNRKLTVQARYCAVLSTPRDHDTMGE